LLTTGRQNRTALLVVVTLIVNLFANLALVKVYGTEGASLARCISTALYLILAIWSLFHYVNRPTWRMLSSPFAALAVAIGTALLLANWPWWLAAAIVAVSYLAALLGIAAVTGDWRSLTGAALSATRTAK
jgi:O-antigen/teichoic acid export membrane protein